MACFTEKLVVKKVTMEDKLLTLLQIVASVVLVMIVSIVPSLTAYWLFIVALIVYLNYYLFKRRNIEFEYSYYDGDITIDKVINKAARKHILSIEMTAVDKFGRLSDLKEEGKKLDYTSHSDNKDEVYFLLQLSKSGNKVILFEPNEEMLDDMRMRFPQKYTR